MSPPGCLQEQSKEVGCEKKPFSEFSEQASLVVGVGKSFFWAGSLSAPTQSLIWARVGDRE